MEMPLLTPLVLLGLALVALMAVIQRHHLASPEPSLPFYRPRVSILKPLRGADPNLEANLASFFLLAYPDFEVLLGVRDADDPAAEVARRVMAAFPQVPARLVVSHREVGLNPKVNNLANMLPHARGELILISDSNVRVRSNYLHDMVAHLHRPGVRLVSSPFRGIGAGTLGTACETLQLNTFVMGGVCAVHRLWDGVCVVGKSMMLHRRDLEAFGGFAHLGRFLAEDQVCGQEVAAAGGLLAVTAEPVDNVVGSLTVSEFLSRHLRWAKIRWRINPVGTGTRSR